MHYQDYENENDGMANGCVRDKIPYLLNKTGQVNELAISPANATW